MLQEILQVVLIEVHHGIKGVPRHEAKQDITGGGGVERRRSQTLAAWASHQNNPQFCLPRVLRQIYIGLFCGKREWAQKYMIQ